MTRSIYDGPRRRPGRPSLNPGERMIPVSGALPAKHKEWVDVLGGGNFSRGLQKAVVLAMQAMSPELAAAAIAEARKPRCTCKDIEDEPDCPVHGTAPFDFFDTTPCADTRDTPIDGPSRDDGAAATEEFD